MATVTENPACFCGAGIDAPKLWEADELKKDLGSSPADILGILAVTECPLQSTVAWFALC